MPPGIESTQPQFQRLPRALVVGSPNVDTMAFVNDGFLAEHNLPKGDATPLQESDAFYLLKRSAVTTSEASGTPSLVGSGGCATNTGKALSGCGIQTSVCGKIGCDNIANTFVKKLQVTGIQDATIPSDLGTGEVLCLITSDGERTFAYRSGATASLEALELLATIERLHAAGPLALVYFDIYVVLSPGNVLESGLKKCQELHIETALNLGSVSIVKENAHRLWSLLEEGLVQVLTLNSEEATELAKERPEAQDVAADASPEEAVAARLAPFCHLVVLTMGIRGVLVVGRTIEMQRFRVAPVEKVLDSTGAGDFYAGGFLAAHIQGKPLGLCHQWGAWMAQEVVQVLSTDMDEHVWDRIRSKMSEGQ